ncbi:MAG: 50S ribosomal protein L13 [Candidatus Aenigmarchaeota archaeon]|nr:50S ribosomal protein L13 [Candidatus Aenigmarchaeota archaeon]
MIVDATHQILGRISSKIAKKLLDGEEVIVINAEKSIVTGDPDVIMKDFKQKIDRGDPHHGPFYPKTPDGIFRRAVRGMLPYKKPHGREAFKKLKVYVGNPKGLDGKMIAKNKKDIECRYLTLEKISKKLRG